MVGETGYCCTVDHTVVTTVAYVDDLALNYLPVVESREGLKLADSNNAGLRREDQRAGVCSTDCTDVGKADCSSLKLF